MAVETMVNGGGLMIVAKLVLAATDVIAKVAFNFPVILVLPEGVVKVEFLKTPCPLPTIAHQRFR